MRHILFQTFVLKECHGWDHETLLAEYLDDHPRPCEKLGLDTVLDQSTLYLSWHHRVTSELRETVKAAAERF